jgi:GTP-binding protein
MSGPAVAIIGRPNVGKSTLFNRLVGERRAVVEDLPGTTVDRIHADLSFEGHDFTLVDCGGLELKPGSGLRRKVRAQIEAAIREAHLLLFVVDAQTGVLPVDEDIADIMRRSQKPVLLVANKVDGPAQRTELHQFYQLNMGDPLPVSAYHGRGVNELLDRIVTALPSLTSVPDAPAEPEEKVMKIAIVGRPNVGKSLLVNNLLGEDRVIVDEVPGTTRDAVDTVLRYYGAKVVLIDTAGIRRPGRVEQGVEKHSLARTKQAIERCDIAVVLVDAVEGITAQDIHILGLVHKAYKGAILGINKIDLVADVGAPAGPSSFSPVGSAPAPRPRKSRDVHPYASPPAGGDPGLELQAPPLPERVQVDAKFLKSWKDFVRQRVKFMPYVEVLCLSAKTGYGVDKLLPMAGKISAVRRLSLPVSLLETVVREAEALHISPKKAKKRLKIGVARQTAVNPPTFVFVANDAKLVHFSYRRHLENKIRQLAGFQGTPIRLAFQNRDEVTGRSS